MRTLIIVAILALSGCSTLNPANWHAYRMDIQQGNLVTQDAVAQLKPGMTRAQVRFILGTPLLSDMFNTNRWDYKYQYFKGYQEVDNKLLTVYFDGDRLVKIEGDAMPSSGPVAPPLGALSASAPLAMPAPVNASSPAGNKMP